MPRATPPHPPVQQCVLCLRPSTVDWIWVINRDDGRNGSAGGWSYTLPDHDLLADASAVMRICENAHVRFHQANGASPLSRQLASPGGVDSVIALLAPPAAGKSYVLQSLRRAGLPADRGAVPEDVFIPISPPPLKLIFTAGEGTQGVQNSTRAALRRMFERGGVQSEKHTEQLEGVLKQRGLSAQEAEGWGLKVHQPWAVCFRRPAGELRLSFMDLAGEDLDADLPAQVARSAEHLLWVVDTAAFLAEPILDDDNAELSRVTQSLRNPQENKLLDLARERRDLAIERFGTVVTMREGNHDNTIAVGKCDLVAFHMTQVGGENPLLGILPCPEQAVESAANALAAWAKHWLDENLMARVSPEATQLLTLAQTLSTPARFEQLIELTERLLNHFGQVEHFWSLVSSGNPFTIPGSVIGQGGDLKAQRASAAWNSRLEGQRVNLRDLVTAVVGRALMVGLGHEPHHLEALAAKSPPERYVLISLVNRYDLSAEKLQNVLSQPAATVGVGLLLERLLTNHLSRGNA